MAKERLFNIVKTIAIILADIKVLDLFSSAPVRGL